MQDNYDPEQVTPEGSDSSASRRTIEDVQADLRRAAALGGALLAFEPPAAPADMARLLPGVDNVLRRGGNLLAAIQRVHRTAELHVDTYVCTSVGDAALITEAFPIAEVAEWSPSIEGEAPVIDVVIRFAADPIAPRERVALTIGYRSSVDGTERLVYRIRSIAAEEAQDPHGA